MRWITLAFLGFFLGTGIGYQGIGMADRWRQEDALQRCLNGTWTKGGVNHGEEDVRYARVPSRFPGDSRQLAHLIMRGCRLQVGLAPYPSRDENQDLWFAEKFGITDLDARLRAALNL